MNNFKLASRSLTRKGRGNMVKIVSLGLGLAVGLVLLTKVFFEYNYESFWPDAGRIHQIVVKYTVGQGDNSEESDYTRTPGGVAPGMASEIPQIEAATRYTPMGGTTKLRNATRETVDASVIIADSCLHDVLPRPMLAGDAKRALATPDAVMISRTLAGKLGAGMGAVIEFDSFPGRSVTVEGIFEDIPENSDFKYDMAISMPTIGRFTWDGSLNWVGNDRYFSFVKLRPGASPGEVVPLMRQVQERHGSVEEMRAAGVDAHYRLTPLLSVHRDDPAIKQSNLLMLLLAVSLIAIALLNYLIITLSTVMGRAREIAVFKCYGAGGPDIRKQLLAETTLHIVLSLGVAAFLVAAFVNPVQEILRTSLEALFSWQGIAIVAGVCVLLLAIATYVPSKLFVNIPAASVFRTSGRGRKTWKLALLGIQFAYAGAFMAILVVIRGQYSMMMDSDPGYEYENVVWAAVSGTPRSQREVAVENLKALPDVEMVSVAYQLPYDPTSGNNIYLPGDERELFNISDLYNADENWLAMMEIPIIEGRGFERGVTPDDDSQMVVNRAFAEKMSQMAGWNDGVVGKTVMVTEHGERTIIGVYENFLVGSIKDNDDRPTVLGYTTSAPIIQVRLREVNGESMRAVQQVLAAAMPDKQIDVNAMKNDIAGLYNDERIERNSIVLCSVITLLIVLLGLVGYLRNEITRRSAEIAIRKINGAETGDVLGLLGREILWVALPALAAGSFVAYYVSRKWMEGFSEQIALTPWLYGASALAVLAVILAVAVAVSYRIAVQNPVESLKTE